MTKYAGMRGGFAWSNIEIGTCLERSDLATEETIEKARPRQLENITLSGISGIEVPGEDVGGGEVGEGGDEEGGGGGEAGQGPQQPIGNHQVKAEECQMRFGVVEMFTLERVGVVGKRWKREEKTVWRALYNPPRPSQT